MITPMDIHNKTFSRKLRGYAEEEVNSFLEEVVSDYERIYREHREMEEQMDALKAKLQNYEKMEATMSSTLMMAQETAENVKKNAQKESELIIREAQSERTHILSDAEAEMRKTKASVQKIETDLNLYTEKLLNTFRSAMTMVESVKGLPSPHVQDQGQETEGEDQVTDTLSPEDEKSAAAEGEEPSEGQADERHE